MRFHVLGVGSIGTLISHHLRHATTSPISLIYKRAKVFRTTSDDDINPNSGDAKEPPLSLSVRRGKKISRSTGFDIEKVHDGSDAFHATARLTPDARNGNIDSLIVCLKTVQTVHALQILAPRLAPTSVITLLQNGMGVYDDLCASVFPDPSTRPQFILGTTTHGAKRDAKSGTVTHVSGVGQGEIKLGVVPDSRGISMDNWLWPNSIPGSEYISTPPPSPNLPLPSPPLRSLSNLHTTLETLLSLSDLSPSLLPMPHLHHQLLLKLAVNATINPLTATLGLGSLPNGALKSVVSGNRLIRYTVSETSAILTAYIADLAYPNAPHPDIVRLFSAEALESRCLSVLHETHSNISSMANDIARNQLTEIEHINGYLVSLAKRLGVDAPRHKMLVEMVKYVSALSNPRGDFQGARQEYRQILSTRRTQFNESASQAAGMKAADKETRRLQLDEEMVQLRNRELMVRESEAQHRKQEARRARRASKQLFWKRVAPGKVLVTGTPTKTPAEGGPARNINLGPGEKMLVTERRRQGTGSGMGADTDTGGR